MKVEIKRLKSFFLKLSNWYFQIWSVPKNLAFNYMKLSLLPSQTGISQEKYFILNLHVGILFPELQCSLVLSPSSPFSRWFLWMYLDFERNDLHFKSMEVLTEYLIHCQSLFSKLTGKQNFLDLFWKFNDYLHQQPFANDALEVMIHC